MKFLFTLLGMLLFFIGCSQNHDTSTTATKTSAIKANTINELHDIMKTATHTVVVKQLSNSGGYTYVLAFESNKTFWIAGPKTALKVGDTLHLIANSWMRNFKSKTLKKTFDVIMFVDTFKPRPARRGTDRLNLVGMKPIESKNGSVSIKRLYDNAKQYENKIVTIHAKIVKANFQIMNKNWVHLVDGSASDKTGLITATTQEKNLNVGDTVLLTGKVVLNKDFGYGYFYTVILEDSNISF